jgi:hypothetical protein
MPVAALSCAQSTQNILSIVFENAVYNTIFMKNELN